MEINKVEKTRKKQYNRVIRVEASFRWNLPGGLPWEGDMWTKSWRLRKRPHKESREWVLDRGNSKCRGSEAGRGGHIQGTEGRTEVGMVRLKKNRKQILGGLSVHSKVVQVPHWMIYLAKNSNKITRVVGWRIEWIRVCEGQPAGRRLQSSS